MDIDVSYENFEAILNQSVTSRLETSRYGDFSQFFESIRVSVSKIFVSKKSLGIGLKKSLGISLENFGP